MKKTFLIGWKDLTLAFRDRAALVLMLAAPFLLTLGLGFVTGRFSGSSGAIQNIPLVLVNQDDGQLGRELVNLFQSSDLAKLVKPTVLADPAQARQQVDADKAAAAVIIPPGFSASIIPAPGAASAGALVKLEVYANPTSPTSAGVIQTITAEFLNQVEVGRASGQVAVQQLLGSGLISPQDAPRLGAEIGARQGAGGAGSRPVIQLKNVASGGEVPFDALAYMAPGMALMFLMYTVSNGGRTLLQEQAQGTLPRLLVSPTSTTQVLAGKVFGIFLTGTAQMLILIGASTLFFQLKWGDPLGVLVIVLAAVAGATGWGLLITAFARTPGQVSAVGSAVMLSFGILGGSFYSISNMPAWFQLLSRITPNAWGLDGFTLLAGGAGLAAVLPAAAALLGMGALLFGIAVLVINKRGIGNQA